MRVRKLSFSWLSFTLAFAACAFAACDSGNTGDAGAVRAAGNVPPRAGYAEVAGALEAMIEREREQKGFAAVSIALADRDGVAWAAGFGEQSGGTPATARTVYRVGSVSKLFTDIAVMQLAERGELDIDTPVATVLPGFLPANPWDEPITLRQLMSHRSGLLREPPAGHYFDDTGTNLEATITSLAETDLVYEPGTRTKYSNAGIAAVGYVLEETQDTPFAEYVKGAVLEPLGMETSAFAPEPAIVSDLADAYMWGFDRGLFAAPTFELGMSPAGSMYSTVLDLSRFLGAMFGRGQGENGRILSAETLESMWQPQFAEAGAAEGYGLGFGVRERFGQRWLGHGGAIYGYSTQLAFLPDAQLGVVVVSAVDGTNSFTSRVADAALALMLAAAAGEPLPVELLRGTDPIKPATASALEGTYGAGDDAIELDERNGELFLTPLRGGSTVALRARGDTLVVDDRLAFGSRYLRVGEWDKVDPTGIQNDPTGIQRDALGVQVSPTENNAPGLLVLGLAPDSEAVVLLRRPPSGLPAPPPARWEGLIGEYGWDHNVLYILERDGRLFALVEWFFMYPLEQIDPDVYAFPDWGLYHGERLIFSRGPSGRASSVEAASIVFPRRQVGTEAGGTFRIDPARPVAELRSEALAADPPAESGPFRESELVEVNTIVPGIQLDVRYSTTNNFMSSVFYDEPRVFLQRPAAEGVARAHRALAEHGFGLLLHDGYRPWYVTKMFWDATPESQRLFVANPANGSRHNRGAAIDLNLYHLATGEPAEMVGTYDEFSPRSFPNYPGGTSRQRWLRELLRRTMEAEGFTVYEAEWWHFDHEDWREYGLQNATFDQLTSGAR